MPKLLPVIYVTSNTLPEAWEKAVIQTWYEGSVIPTQYDKPDDPPSRDAIAIITIEHPMSEPRIHRAFPAGIAELEVYRQEVVDGIHDHWICPEEGKWEYTYHERLFAYSVPGQQNTIDQIEYVINTLVETPFSRRAQAITWKPWEDAGISDPACLQRMWFRIFDDQLVLNVHMRSNDAFKAAFMNMYAFTDLQRIVAEKISEKLGREIKVGQYTHIADSFHIYGSYFEEFQKFLDTLNNRTFEQRTYSTDDVIDIIEEARIKIKKSLIEESESGRKGL